MNIVEITKLRTNYKLRYNYLAKLTNFIKQLPRDQYETKVDPILNPDGTPGEDWYRIISPGSIGKIICFIKDNQIPFRFTNLTKEEVDELRSQFLQKQKQTADLLRLRTKDFNIDLEDFSYLKIEPYKYQKQAVVFFETCNGTGILGDQPGVGKSLVPMAYGAKHKFKTLIICPASLKLNWRNEILKFTNELPFIYKWKPTKKSGKINHPKEDSLFHIINYEGLETYAKFNVSHKCNRCQWQEVSLRKSYKECPNCKAPKSYVKSRRKDLIFIEDKKGVVLNPKDYDLVVLDECFSYNTIVKTEFGNMSIGYIVENKLDVKILSYDIENDKLEYKKINRWIKKENYTYLLKITIADGTHIICTPNHKIYTKEKGYVRADEIKKDHTLYQLQKNSNDIIDLQQKQNVFSQMCRRNKSKGHSDYLLPIMWWKKEDRSIKFVRVESVEILERRGGQKSTINNTEDTKVYNLEINKNHNYFANDILVSNCHLIKNSSAGRTYLTKKMFKDSPRKLLLTGTAIKSRPYEFFSLLNFVDPLTWKSAHKYGIRYCAAEQNQFGWNYDGASNLDELYQRISPYFLRRLKRDVLEHLPPKTYSNIPIELSATEMREYKKIENNAIAESSEDDDDMTHLARIQYLKKFTTDIKVNRALPFIQDIIDGGEKVVVFSQYISSTEVIANYFGDKAVCFTGKKNQNEKQEAVDRFMEDDSVQVFAGTIGAAGAGITLTSASIAMFIDYAWTPGDMTQAEDRIHRASTTADNVQIIKLICQETIDEEINELLNRKSQILSRVLDGSEFEKVEKESVFKELINIIVKKKKPEKK